MNNFFSGSVIIRLVSVVLLLWALDSHAYGYYKILRWVVCGVSGYLTYTSYTQKKNTWTWIFGIIAVLFNPIAPIHLDRDTWAVIDIIVAVLILISIFVFKNERSKE